VAQPGEKPAAAAGDMVTINAKVKAINLKDNTVTFKGPKGNLRTVAVQDPTYQAALKKLKVGDVVEITYAEALAITVEPAKKK
jgi:Cu/Ag efflux protein CusF